MYQCHHVSSELRFLPGEFMKTAVLMPEINHCECKNRKERNPWHKSSVLTHSVFPLAESHLSLGIFLLPCSLERNETISDVPILFPCTFLSPLLFSQPSSSAHLLEAFTPPNPPTFSHTSPRLPQPPSPVMYRIIPASFIQIFCHLTENLDSTHPFQRETLTPSLSVLIFPFISLVFSLLFSLPFSCRPSSAAVSVFKLYNPCRSLAPSRVFSP